MRSFNLFLFFLLACSTLHAQNPTSIKVSNDDAANAMALIVDSGYHKSNTTNCTIEEECIDRKLTSKCLVYHNDQWFTFRTTDSLTYYLIVKNQNCRDINGVQLLVIDGSLCKPATYNILKCISLATQDDISLTLTELQPNHQYILNLDGYLNDFCEFEISISTIPPDFHIRTTLPLKVAAQAKTDKIEFTWQLSDELIEQEITKFEIVRRAKAEKRFSLRKSVDAERSVKGDYTRDYKFTDSITSTGVYFYKIIAVSEKGERFLLDEHSFQLHINPYLIPLDLDVKKKTVLTIEIYDYPFNHYLGTYKAVYNENFKLNLKPYINEYTQQVKLSITDLDKKFKKEIVMVVK